MPRDGARNALRLVPLTPELFDLAIQLERDALTRATADNSRFREFALAERGLAYALLDGGRLLGAGGIVLSWPTMGEVWLLISSLARRREIVHGIRIAREFMAARQEARGILRLEFHCRHDAPWRESFIAALGFRHEARLEAYGPDGSDYDLYAQVRRWQSPSQ